MLYIELPGLLTTLRPGFISGLIFIVVILAATLMILKSNFKGKLPADAEDNEVCDEIAAVQEEGPISLELRRVINELMRN